MKAIEGLRAAGAEVVFDDAILPDEFADVAARVGTTPYVREGTEKFLAEFGPAQYHSVEEYRKAVGSPLPATITGPAIVNGMPGAVSKDQPIVSQALIESDPQAEANVFGPRRKALATYNDTLERLHLDGYVYPATQMPPPDETMPQDGGISGGPHSDTSWVNILGVPAIVVPGGFYPDGLPFGLEISTRYWKDGDLLGWAYAYEQATHLRRPPVLVEEGLLPDAR
jgi:Asp-tRNA(Asn)/Glu-tRNA(Gln) amidotransferase A subunit family amidase